MAPDDPRLTSDVSEFDFDASTNDSWRAFAARLAEVLSVMDAGASLRIGAMAATPDDAPPYVTFRCGDGGSLVAEAALDGRLGDAPEREAHLARLAADGWRRVPGAASEGSEVAFALAGSQEEALALASAATDALRHVYGVQHPALLAPDQLADILTPTPVERLPEVEPGRIDPILTPSREALDAALFGELTGMLGHEPLRDAQGDFAIRVGSTMVFLRPSADGDEVLVFAPLVHEVEGRSRAMELLSDLNTEARWVRFLLIRDRVYVSLSVFADPLIPRHLHRAFRIVSMISDSIDEHLAGKLRGRTTFREGDADAGPAA